MEIIYAILSIYLCASLGVVESGIPFVYNTENSGDPRKVALLRDALIHAGISPDGIIVKSISAKWEILRTSYKATYINKQGQTCFLKWRVNDLIGTQSPRLPVCENVPTGTGSDPLRIKVPSYPVYNPIAVPRPYY